jgi:hypothetical protein
MSLPLRARAAGLLALSLPLVLAACGGGSADPKAATDAGYAALGSGDAQTAVDHFAEALGALEPTDPGYKRARMGEIEAKIGLAPDAAASSFLEYSKSQPEQLEPGDYRKVGVQLSDRKALKAAVDVLDAGLSRFADDPKLKEAMDLTVAAAETSGDTSALDALRSLGYLGGD